MKKIVAVVILIVMMLGIFMVCEAELPDISGLSYEELVEMRTKINETISGKMIFKPFLPDGYEIGKDIAEGIYEFSITEPYPFGGWNSSVMLTINKEGEEPFTKVICEGEKGIIKLEKGSRLVIEAGELHLERVG